MKKTLLLLGALGALITGPALAADLVLTEAEAQVYAPDAVDWTGPYIGVNAGVAWGLFQHPFGISYECYDDIAARCYEEDGLVEVATGSGDVTAGGFVAGVQAGYNVQFDSMVLGIEADLQHSTVDGRVSIDAYSDLGGGLDLYVDAGTHLDWFGTLRLRAGALLTEQALLYVTAGLAAGQTTSSLNAEFNGSPVLDLSETLDRVGYTAGFGIEYALTENVRVKTEYLYTDLGTERLFDGPVFGPIGATVDSAVAFHTVRAGVNFAF